MTNRLILLTGSLLFAAILTAQRCTGNLGENIFTEGDFGSGPDLVLPNDPGIAPGFSYVSSPPPNDGGYTITSNTGRWANIFPAWGGFPDNSADPNGYFMVVNASFSPGKFYEQQVDDLCENTLYQFSADVRNVIRRGSNQLLPDVSFSINDEIKFTTGPIAEDETWNTYGFTFTTEPGQTSVTLALLNNAPGGFGNDLALDNISFRACGPAATIVGAENLRLCQDGAPVDLTAMIVGDQYDDPALQWEQSSDNGLTWQTITGATGNTFVLDPMASGFYLYRFLLANGTANLANSKCRIVSNVKSVFVVPKRWEIIDTICSGLSFEVGENSYSNSGVTIDTLISTAGCDSIVTLVLTVVPDPGIVPDFSITEPSCPDRSDGEITLNAVTGGAPPLIYTLDGLERDQASPLSGLEEGDYRYTLMDRFGCSVDGLLSLRSTVFFAVELGEDRVVELGESIRFDDGTDQEVTTYSFTPPGIVDCTADCDGRTFRPTETVTLRLLATSPTGCEARDSVSYTVLKNRKVYPPTAFSPNGDGINDRFTLFGDTPSVTMIASLRIFDRWGGEVFAGENFLPNELRSGWDGTVNNRPAPAGLYHYTAEVVFLDGVVLPYAGSVMLVN